MPGGAKPLFQGAVFAHVGLTIRAGSTRAQPSGTSIGLGAALSSCFCYSLTDRAPILSWAPPLLICGYFQAVAFA